MERRQQVEEIFHAALQRDPAERETYLCQACGDDSGLRREVTSLLADHSADDRSGSWAAAAAAQLVNPSNSLQPGQSLGSPLGRVRGRLPMACMRSGSAKERSVKKS